MGGGCSLWGEGVSKAYPGVVVFEGASWRFRGRLTLLLAPNGSGKTTLIKLSLGLARPDRGRAGTCASTRREVSFLLDAGEPPGWASVEGLFRYMMGLRGLGYSRGEAVRALEEVGLDPGFLGRRLGGLSSGERQRVLLAAALAGNPEVLVLDEPFSGLDPLGRARVSLLVNRAARDRRVVVATHILSLLDADEAYTILDRRVHGPLPPPRPPGRVRVYNLATGDEAEVPVGELEGLGRGFVVLSTL